MRFMLVVISRPNENFEGKGDSGKLYEVNFDGFYPRSGVYSQSLIFENSTIRKKMILIKR
jgi:hypothetical protein